MFSKIRRNNSGVILIFALWVLGFLTLIVVHIGFGVRQKITLLKRMEDRAQLQRQAESGVKKSIAIISEMIANNPTSYTVVTKNRLHNNSQEFQNMAALEDGSICHVSYRNELGQEFFGVMDEERKININRADPWMVKAIVEMALGVSPAVALEFAGAIYRWREPGGDGTPAAFDQYYENLEHSYMQKSDAFEHIDELLLIRGINKSRFEKLTQYLTVYGEGQVNINTASAEVLGVLGLPFPLIEKIFIVRRGKDQIEGTLDDFVFQRVFDVASDINQIIRLEPTEAQFLDQLNRQGWLTTQSFFYKIESHAQPGNSQTGKSVEVVFNSKDHWVEYWKEK